MKTEKHNLRVAGILGLLLAGLHHGSAQTNVAAPGTPENRFLLIVETSRAMEKRSEGVAAALNSLLSSGMKGQLRTGDTLGVWTYNDDLHAGEFPLQQWPAEGREAVTAELLKFVKSQKFEKKANFTKVLPELEQVVKGSEFITIILVSSGLDPINGTPFDAQINQSFRTWREEQQKSRKPLITLFRARHGQPTDYSVTPAPWQVEMPPLPAELRIAKTKPADLPRPAPKPQVAALPPLIVSGKKSNPVSGSTLTETNQAGTTLTVGQSIVNSNSAFAPVTKLAAGTTSVRDPGSLQVFAREASTNELVNSPAGAVSPMVAAANVEQRRNPLQNRFWLMAAAAFGVAVGMVLVLVSRLRRQPQLSYITQSLGRDQKQGG